MKVAEFFDKLFKPKWKHKNPKVRKQALQALDSADAETIDIYVDVAKQDPDPVVRQWVVSYLGDLQLLLKIASVDPDAIVRQHAVKRIGVLLCTSRSGSLEQQLSLIKTFHDKRVLEYVARNGEVSDLRWAAACSFDREPLFGDMAINDPDPEMRMQAVARINQKSVLERVLKQVRTKDKRMRAATQQRLDALLAEQDRPTHLNHTAINLCVQLEGLDSLLREDKGNWKSVESSCARLEKEWGVMLREWDEVNNEACDEEITARFAKGFAQIATLIKQHQSVENQQATLMSHELDVEKHKQWIIKEMQELLVTLEHRDEPQKGDDEDITRLLAIVNEIEPAAKAQQQEEKTEAQVLFDGLVDKITHYRDEVANYSEYKDRLLTLIQTAEKLTKSKQSISINALTYLEKIDSTLPQSCRFKALRELTATRHKLLKQIHDRLVGEKEASRSNVLEFTAGVAEFKQRLEDGKVDEATEKGKQLQKLVDRMVPADLAQLRKKRAMQGYQRAVARLKELCDWKSWASTPLREKLIHDMTLLVQEIKEGCKDASFDFEEAAKSIQRARNEWKKLGAGEPAVAATLWERFNKTCNEAYEPCQAYFGKQMAQRADNLVMRNALCEKFETYIKESIEGREKEDIDWLDLQRFQRAIQKEWKSFGPVKRSDFAIVRPRFQTASDKLKVLLQEEKDRNAAKKRVLVTHAEGIASVLVQEDKELTAVNDAVKEIKILQKKWKMLGRASDEKSLWQAFRAAIDVVFTTRQAKQDEHIQAERENLATCVALCESIEKLSLNDGVNQNEAKRFFNKACQEWQDIGAVAKRDDKAIKRRFARACNAFEQKQQTWLSKEKIKDQVLLIAKGRLCRAMESLLEEVVVSPLAARDVVARRCVYEEEWSALAMLSDNWENAMQQRFTEAQERITRVMSNAQHATEVVRKLDQQKEENLPQKEALCLRMEILAGIESPPEIMQARMEYQVSQLADKMKQRGVKGAASEAERATEATEINVDWHSMGPVPLESQEELDTRFGIANAAFCGESSKKKANKNELTM